MSPHTYKIVNKCLQIREDWQSSPFQKNVLGHPVFLLALEDQSTGVVVWLFLLLAIAHDQERDSIVSSRVGTDHHRDSLPHCLLPVGGRFAGQRKPAQPELVGAVNIFRLVAIFLDEFLELCGEMFGGVEVESQRFLGFREFDVAAPFEGFQPRLVRLFQEIDSIIGFRNTI